jgi:hypothetical protein
VLDYDRVVRHTSRKRSSHDPLARVRAPTWLVVRDRANTVLESTKLAPATDLRAVLTKARDARIAAGVADDIGRACGFFFVAGTATESR